MYSSIREEIPGNVKRERKEWMSEEIWTLMEERRVLKDNMEAELRQGTKRWPHLAKCFWQEPEGVELEPITKRLINARFESKCQNTTIIQVYAPTRAKEKERGPCNTNFRPPSTRITRKISPWLSKSWMTKWAPTSDHRESWGGRHERKWRTVL